MISFKYLNIKSVKLLFCLLVTVAAVPACQREKYTEKGIPEVETRGVTVMKDGAAFYGEILSDGGKNITEHGFLWGVDENPVFGGSDFILLGPHSGTGEYSATVSGAIEKDRVYYMRSFIKTADITSYGNIITFKGEGSKPPVLKSVIPQSAVCGDTVIIKGENLTYIQSDCRVLFGNIAATILSAARDELMVIVPVAPEGSIKINVTVSGLRSVDALNFIMKMPLLTGFYPVTGTFGDVITLSGSNFSLDTSNIYVYFDNARARIVGSSRTYYRVEVPVGNDKSPASVKIKYFNYYAYGNEFSLSQAVISDVSPRVCRPYETVVITGENFNPWPEGNVVRIGEVEAYVVSSTSTSITIMLPDGLTPGINTVSVTTINDTPVTWSGTIEVLVTWKKLSDFPASGRVAGSGFATGGKVYFGTGIEPELHSVKDFWEYDPATDTWTQKSNYPVIITYATGFSINGKGYFTLGKSGSYFNALTQYDTENDTWTSMTPRPGPGSSMDSPGFVIDGNAYVPAAGTMYMYNPATDTWTAKSYPAELGYLGGPAAFSINGKGYLGVGWMVERDCNIKDFYEYDPATDTWTRKASFPGILRGSATSFSLPNGKGYVMMGYANELNTYLKDVWEYDPVEDKWTRLNDFPGSPRFGARAMVIGNDAYIMTGYGGVYEKDLYRFSPGN
jgi:N-acetylneuraminic acid mutarotase